MTGRIKKHRSKRLGFLAIAFVLGLAVLLSVWPVPSTFAVSAQTESIHFTTGSNKVPDWQLKDVLVFEGPGPAPSRFSGRLSLAPGVDVEIERTSGGPLRIECRPYMAGVQGGSGPTVDSQPVAILSVADDEPVREIKKRLVMRVDDIDQRAKLGESLLLPVVGDVVLGGRGLQSAVLRSGVVVILGTTLLQRGLFEGGRAALEVGDVFSTPKSVGPAVGFVVADERVALTVSYRVVATEGEVRRFASQGYSIGLTPLARIKSDSVIQGVYLSAIFIFGVARILAGRPERPGKEK
jgi:hypothetical protein